MGEHVRLYLPSSRDFDSLKNEMKRMITQVVAWSRGASQTRIANAVRGDKRLVRECLNELTARGILRCDERIEKGNRVMRYYIIFD
jgi:transcription initiation factor IIE alpha subunit